MTDIRGTGLVFISHSSKDKNFTEQLAIDLRAFGVEVWYDAWAIDLGDSIVDKVFSNLGRSNVLLVLISRSSIDSKWVKEELNVSIMRRLSSDDIRIIPVRLDNAELPNYLQHILYSDFRGDYNEAMHKLIRSLIPTKQLWDRLSLIYDKFFNITSFIAQAPLDSLAEGRPSLLHDLLDQALTLRVKIEEIETGKRSSDVDEDRYRIFNNIAYLRLNGVDARSAAWHSLVHYNSFLAHSSSNSSLTMRIFIEMLDETGYFAQSVYAGGLPRPPIFQEEYDALADPNDAIRLAMKELNFIAEMLCKSDFPRRHPYQPRW